MNKNLPRIIIGIVAVAGIFLFSVFNNSNDEIGDFNDRIVELIDNMDITFEDYYTELEKYYYYEEVDNDILEEETGKIREIADDTKEEINKVKIPEHDICIEFHTAAVGYVLNGIKLCDAFTVLNQYIRTHNPAENEDLDYADNILNPLFEEYDRILNLLVTTQKKMANEFNFEVQ